MPAAPVIPARASSGPARFEPITVAHCLHALSLGGAQQVIRQLAAASDRRRFRHLVYVGGDGVSRRAVEGAGADIVVLPRRIPKFDPLWLAQLGWRMRRDRVDVVHAHLFGDTLHGVLAAELSGARPVVMTLHNSTRNFTALQLWAYRRLIPRCARVVACSPSAQRSFAELLGADAAGRAIDCIPNGLDAAGAPAASTLDAAAVRAELGLPATARIVGASGRLVGQKRFDDLIVAFAAACAATRDPDLRLVILGSGPLLDDLRRRARTAGVGERVLLPGFRDDARRLAAAFDVVVFSSDFEGLPMALLEAMAARRCIVATAAPGLADVLTDGRDAVLVAPRDPEAMSRALRRVLDDEPLRGALGAAARATYETTYTAERMAAQYARLYREVVGGSARAAG